MNGKYYWICDYHFKDWQVKMYNELTFTDARSQKDQQQKIVARQAGQGLPDTM